MPKLLTVWIIVSSVQSLSYVQFFATPWTAACQASLVHRQIPELAQNSCPSNRWGHPTLSSYGKFLKRWKYQTILPASWEICMQVKKQQLELDMEQWACSKLRKEYVKAVYCHPAYLTYMQSTSSKMLGWMKHKLVSKLQEEISIISDMQMTPLLWQKAKRN